MASVLCPSGFEQFLGIKCFISLHIKPLSQHISNELCNYILPFKLVEMNIKGVHNLLPMFIDLTKNRIMLLKLLTLDNTFSTLKGREGLSDQDPLESGFDCWVVHLCTAISFSFVLFF